MSSLYKLTIEFQTQHPDSQAAGDVWIMGMDDVWEGIN